MLKHTVSFVAAVAALLFVAGIGLAQSSESTAEKHAIKASTLKVPGAKLYYEIQGTGPLLLMIPGGPADAGAFSEIARRLADQYTVVAYDPRGNSRSTFDSATEELQPDVIGDDAARLIEALGNGPAYVFGSSGGAQIGLNLAARHPKLVRVLVAHEPPCLSMLDDPSKSIANNKEVYDTYKSEGTGAAMQKFMAMNGMSMQAKQSGQPKQGSAPPPTPSPAFIETMTRIQSNFEYFLAHALVPLSLYRPDVDSLRSNKTRVIVGVGAETAGQTANRTGVALAKMLGTKPVIFPGDHNGYGPHADAFAVILHQSLRTK